MSGTNTRSTVLDRLVCKWEVTQVVSNHFWLDFNLWRGNKSDLVTILTLGFINEDFKALSAAINPSVGMWRAHQWGIRLQKTWSMEIFVWWPFPPPSVSSSFHHLKKVTSSLLIASLTHLVECFSIVNSNNWSDHFGHNDHVAKMCLDNSRFL